MKRHKQTNPKHQIRHNRKVLINFVNISLKLFQLKLKYLLWFVEKLFRFEYISKGDEIF